MLLISLLAKYDPVLKKLIENPQSQVKYLSPKVQNELIYLISDCVKQKLLEEIKEDYFYSVILDTTQDITKIDQLSIIIRYAKVAVDENGKQTALLIKESFVGFLPVHDHWANGLMHDVIQFFDKHGISIQKCRGQAYDGASVMDGVYNGLQAKIMELENNAIFFHCAAHNINLIMNDAVKGVPEITAFFDTLESLYRFFTLVWKDEVY